jgi:hypothetical protein
MYLGWDHVGARLQAATVPYEETGCAGPACCAVDVAALHPKLGPIWRLGAPAFRGRASRLLTSTYGVPALLVMQEMAAAARGLALCVVAGV